MACASCERGFSLLRHTNPTLVSVSPVGQAKYEPRTPARRRFEVLAYSRARVSDEKTIPGGRERNAGALIAERARTRDPSMWLHGVDAGKPAMAGQRQGVGWRGGLVTIAASQPNASSGDGAAADSDDPLQTTHVKMSGKLTRYAFSTSFRCVAASERLPWTGARLEAP